MKITKKVKDGIIVRLKMGQRHKDKLKCINMTFYRNSTFMGLYKSP